MNVQVNIANVTPMQFARWMGDHYPSVMFTALPATSQWAGELEEGIAAQFWDIDRRLLDDLLTQYGIDHPAEEAFGVLPLPDSFVVTNETYARKAA